MYKRYKLYLIISLFFFLTGGAFLQTQAQETSDERTYGIVITPAIEFLNLVPGETYSGEISLTNDLEVEEDITLYPVAYMFTEDSDNPGSPVFLFDTSAPLVSDISAWTTFSNTQYFIAHRDTIKAEYDIKVPENAEPGGHYLALVFLENSEESSEAININKAIATLAFATIAGDTVQQGQLVDFKPSQSIYAFTPVNLEIVYENSGNVHDVIGGDIFIHRGDITNPVAQFEVNSTGRISFPGTTRTFTEQFTSGFIQLSNDGTWSLVKDQFPTLPFGQYTATLKLKHTVGNVRETTTRDVTFWIIPWPVILAFVIVVLLLFVYVYNRQQGVVKYVKSKKYQNHK